MALTKGGLKLVLMWCVSAGLLNIQMASGSTLTCSSPYKDWPWSFFCPHYIPPPSVPQVTLAPEGHVVRSEVMLTCNVQSSAEVVISWEKNRVALTGVTSRNLSVNATAGRDTYRCAASIAHPQFPVSRVSKSVTVETPRLDGWIDTVYPQAANDSEISLQLPPGAPSILECRPRINYPFGAARVIWTRDNVKISADSADYVLLGAWSLVVRGVVIPAGKDEVVYRCMVVGLEHHPSQDLSRTFNLSTSDADVNSTVTLLPTNQTVVQGENCTFYCLLPPTSPPSRITWYKDGIPLVSSGPISEVLVLRNVSVKNDGTYSCRDEESGQSYSATLRVIAPPTSVRILGTTISTDVIIGDNEGVNLTCLAVAPSNQTDMSYVWYHNGVPVSATGLSGGGVVSEGNVLRVGPGVTGPVQCFGRNRAGSESAIVTLVTKPRPPINLSYQFKYRSDEHFSLYIGLNMSPPPGYRPTTSLAFRVNVSVHRPADHCYQEYILSDSDMDEEGLLATRDVPIQHYVGNQNGFLAYIGVATVVGGMVSDYVWLDESGGNCNISVFIEPHNETFLNPDITYTRNGRPDLLNMTLRWTKPESAVNGFLNDCRIKVQCGGNSTVNVTCNKSLTSLTVPVPGCVPCNWTVEYSEDTDEPVKTLANTLSFTTSAVEPYQPPEVKGVSRIGSDGVTVQMAFAVPMQSCAPTSMVIKYPGHETTPPLSLSNCFRTHSDYVCDVQLDRIYCWRHLEMQVAYRTSGGQSPFSNVTELEGVTADDLKLDFTVSSTSSNQSTINYTIPSGFLCSSSYLQIHVCAERLTPHTVPRHCSNDGRMTGGEDSCVTIDYSLLVSRYLDTQTEEDFSSAVNTSHLAAGTSYAITTVVTYARVIDPLCVESGQINAYTLEGIPQSKPQNVSVEGRGSTLVLTWLRPKASDQYRNITYYLVFLSNDTTANSTSVVGERYTQKYDPSLSYAYSVAACTSEGCGPSYEGVYGKSSASSVLSSSKTAGVSVAVLVTFVLLTIAVCLITLCIRRVRKKADYRVRLTLSQENLLGGHNEHETGSNSDIVEVEERQSVSGRSEGTIINNLYFGTRNFAIQRFLQEPADGSVGVPYEEEEAMEADDISKKSQDISSATDEQLVTLSSSPVLESEVADSLVPTSTVHSSGGHSQVPKPEKAGKGRKRKAGRTGKKKPQQSRCEEGDRLLLDSGDPNSDQYLSGVEATPPTLPRNDHHDTVCDRVPSLAPHVPLQREFQPPNSLLTPLMTQTQTPLVNWDISSTNRPASTYISNLNPIAPNLSPIAVTPTITTHTGTRPSGSLHSSNPYITNNPIAGTQPSGSLHTTGSSLSPLSTVTDTGPRYPDPVTTDISNTRQDGYLANSTVLPPTATDHCSDATPLKVHETNTFFPVPTSLSQRDSSLAKLELETQPSTRDSVSSQYITEPALGRQFSTSTDSSSQNYVTTWTGPAFNHQPAPSTDSSSQNNTTWPLDLQPSTSSDSSSPQYITTEPFDGQPSASGDSARYAHFSADFTEHKDHFCSCEVQSPQIELTSLTTHNLDSNKMRPCTLSMPSGYVKQSGSPLSLSPEDEETPLIDLEFDTNKEGLKDTDISSETSSHSSVFFSDKFETRTKHSLDSSEYLDETKVGVVSSPLSRDRVESEGYHSAQPTAHEDVKFDVTPTSVAETPVAGQMHVADYANISQDCMDVQFQFGSPACV